MENRERRATSTPIVIDGVLRFAQDPVEPEGINGTIPYVAQQENDVRMIRIQNPPAQRAPHDPPLTPIGRVG